MFFYPQILQILKTNRKGFNMEAKAMVIDQLIKENTIEKIWK